MLRRALIGIVGSLALIPGAFAAPAYPARPVRVVVPYAAGGSTDSTARLVADALQKRLGQPFVVDNRPGAGGVIGHEIAAAAAADGYTLLFSSAGPLTITPHANARLRYDPLNAFAPIKYVARSPLVLLVGPKLPADSVKGLVALSKERPQGLSYGSFGAGSASHLAGEMFRAATGANIVHVPYRGSAPALNDLLAGNIDTMFDVLVTGLPHLQAGTLRALAVTGPTRADALPDVPTMIEAGVPGYDAATWFGLLAPAGTPTDVVDLLSRTLDDVLAQPAFQAGLRAQGAEVVGGTPAAFKAFIASEFEKWGRAAKVAGVRPE